MTEREWVACEDPMPMLAALRGRASARKLRLFACGCCRTVVWHLLDERSREAVAVAERFADGRATASELGAARQRATEALVEAGGHGTKAGAAAFAAQTATRTDWSADVLALQAAAGAYALEGRRPAALERRSRVVRERYRAAKAGMRADRAKQAGLLRDIFANPFRPPPAMPASVLTRDAGCVARLAEAAYEERDLPDGTLDNGRLAVLADALEEAGLDEEEVLGHLRELGREHYRGCWCLDLLLNKG